MLADEEKILKEIKRNPEQFRILFDHYYPRIFGYVLRRVYSFDKAKDIAAETFLKAYLKIGSFKWKGISFSSWLYRIATNEINLSYRQKDMSAESLDRLNDEFHFEPAGDSSFEEDKERVEEELKKYSDFETIQELITSLLPKYQTVISLRYFEQKSIKEISEIINSKEGTVKSLLSRGIVKLRMLYENPADEGRKNK